MSVDPVSNLTISFVGPNAADAREAIWTYLLDGGGEDALLGILEQNANLAAEMSWEAESRTLTFHAMPATKK